MDTILTLVHFPNKRNMNMTIVKLIQILISFYENLKKTKPFPLKIMKNTIPYSKYNH